MNLKEMYEELATLTKSINTITDKKVKMVSKIKSAKEEEDLKGYEKELDELNKKFNEAQEALDKLNAKIRDKEDEIEEVSDEVAKSKSFKGGKENMNKDYLKSKKSYTDFAELFVKTGGGEQLRKEWTKHLKTKGFVNGEDLLPTPLLTEITDVFGYEGRLFNLLNHTGLNGHKVAIELSTDPQAYGHKPGKAKKEQVNEPIIIEITTQGIYKYLTLDRSMSRNNSSEAILRYVMAELPQRLITAIERAVVVGDGLPLSSDDKITSFQSVKDSQLTKKIEASTVTEVIDGLVGNVSSLSYKENLVAVIGAGLLSELKTAKSPDGSYLFPLGFSLEEAIGVKEIFTPVWLEDDVAIIFDTKAYDVDSANQGLETFQDFNLEYNKDEFLVEMYAGGALVKPNSAIMIDYEKK